jgi:hypothetical protein
MPDAFSFLLVAEILIGVGVFRTRSEYRREISALKGSIDRLQDQLQAVQK